MAKLKWIKLRVVITIPDGEEAVDINYNLSVVANNKKEAKKKAVEIIRNNIELRENVIYKELNNIIKKPKNGKRNNRGSHLPNT